MPRERLRPLLERLGRLGETGPVTVGAMLDCLGSGAFLPLLVVPAMLVVSPLSIIPTLPSVCGLIVALVALQMLCGRLRPWLPGILLRRSLSPERLSMALLWLERPAGWIDRTASRRLTILVRAPASGLLIAACMMSGAAMPLLELFPFASSILGAAICLMATGLLARDGALALLGLAVMSLGLGAVAWLVAAATA